MGMQSVVRAIYPPQCVSCGAQTETEHALCGPCWRDTGFVGGLVCDLCGVPLPGADQGQREVCDDCMTIARPWSQGRAVFLYKDNGRKLVLQFKHGDRTDLARPGGDWMARAAAPLLREGQVIVPVPLHWTRLLRRKYNQAALLANRMGAVLRQSVCPDALIRPRRTPRLDGFARDLRFATVQGRIAVNPARKHVLRDRPVLIVDDVMTSGATFAAAAEAALSAGAAEVCVLALARVAKDA
ncbi:MAG: ComF family protein [Rubellimicrobium sp.]|nr:ComF family protein [Rubellimicrobium sp.]